MSHTAPLLHMEGICKSFGSAQVLREVDLRLDAGEVLALLGANGAGKSTLVKILCGVYSRDAGTVRLDDQAVRYDRPEEAIAHGVRFLPQEVSVLPDLTVAENILIADLPLKRSWLGKQVDRPALRARARALLDRLGCDLDPDAPVHQLSAPHKRLVEIARALAGQARVIVMDEPTAALADREVQALFAVVERLKAQQIGIIYISHYLDEVFEIADRITVLRDGLNAGDFATATASRREVLDAMLGTTVDELYPPLGTSIGEVALEVENLSLPGALDGVSFALHRGEILGVFGLLGSGIDQLGRAIYGALGPLPGARIALEGAPYTPINPRRGRDAGIGFVAAERQREGIVPDLGVSANITLPFIDRFVRLFSVSKPREVSHAQSWIDRLGIRAAHLDQPLRLLSGGNQQKACLARWLVEGLKVLILEEPTRGVDVGARHELYSGAAAVDPTGPCRTLDFLRRRRSRWGLRPFHRTRPRSGVQPLFRRRGPGRPAPLTDRERPSMSIATLLNRPGAGVALLLIFYLLVAVLFSVLSPWFLSFDNMVSIGANMAFIGLMCALQTPLIIAGGLDLSVAAVAGLAGVVVALLHASGVGIVAACLIALALGGGIGLLNGLLVVRLGLNSLIATLGTMSVIGGLALVLTGGLTKPLMEPGFNWIGSGQLLRLPVPLVLMLLVYIALGWVLARTRFGRFVYAAGSNAEASRLVGVPVARTLMILYVLSGLSGAVSGLILAAMLYAAAPDAAGQHLLTVIAAVILGGTSLFGGRGTVWGTLLAVLLLGTLNNGLTLMDVSSFWQDVTRGAVLLLAVGLDQVRTRAAGA